MTYIWLAAGRVMSVMHSLTSSAFARLPALFAGSELYCMGRAIGLKHPEARDLLVAARSVARLMAIKAHADHRNLMSGKADDDIDRGIKASGFNSKNTPQA